MNKFPFVAFIALALEVFADDCMKKCPFGSFCKGTYLNSIAPSKFKDEDTNNCVVSRPDTAYKWADTCRTGAAGLTDAICLKRVMTHCQALPGHYRNIGVFLPKKVETPITDNVVFPTTGRYTPINWNFLVCATTSAAQGDACLPKGHEAIKAVPEFVFNTVKGDPGTQTSVTTLFSDTGKDFSIKVGSSIDNSLIFPKCSTTGKFSVIGAIGYDEDTGCTALTSGNCPYGHVKLDAKTGVNGNACIKCEDYQPNIAVLKTHVSGNGFAGTAEKGCGVCPAGKYSKKPKAKVTTADLALAGNCLSVDSKDPSPKCSVGKFCDGNNQNEQQCPNGMTSDPGAKTAADCFCPLKFGKLLDGKCVSDCTAHKICTYSTTAVELAECPADTLATSGGGTVYDCICKPGYYMDFGSPAAVLTGQTSEAAATTTAAAYSNTYAEADEKKVYSCKECPIGWMCYNNLKVVCSWCVGKGAKEGAATTATQASAVSLLVVFCYIFILTPLRLVTA